MIRKSLAWVNHQWNGIAPAASLNELDIKSIPSVMAVRFGQSPSDMFNVGSACTKISKRGESQVSGRQKPQASRECFHGISWRDRDRESNDLVNHIGGVFRYFIVDVVDHGSTPDVARCGRELSKKFLSHEQGLNCMSSERDMGIMSLYSATNGHHNPPQVVSEHRIIDSWSPRLEEERHMKKLPSEIEETRKVKEIFGLQEKKENCWTFFAAAAQVYGGRIHESVESVEMISSYEIRAASTRKKGFGAVFDLQSQGVCDYMHWNLGFLHVLQVIGTESIVEHKGFRTGFVWDFLKIHSVSHVILGTRGRLRTLNDMSVSWLFQMVFFSQREGCCRTVEGDRLMRVCLCVIMRVYSRVKVQRTRYYKIAIFRGNAVWWRCQIEIDSGWKHVCFGFSAWDSVVVCFGFSVHMRGKQMGLHGITVAEVLQELQVSIDISWKFWRRRINRFTITASETREETFTEDDLKACGGFRGYLKGRQTHIKSNLDLRRWNQRSSISQGLKIFQGSQGMQVILAKDDQQILQLHSFSEVVRVTRKVSGYKKKARIVTKRNRVEQVVTTGCNPEDKGYETIIINTCSRSIKSLPQLVETCLEKLVMGSSFDTREAVREYLRSITGLDDERYIERPT
ncbi:hypothetical protein DY000_02012823 [Brassica cretica]|uniref:Thioredoxin domain-containing protein n=1 Tax=Brassica cretica TaxID=69181 RepID=A0ABQ7CNW7_BRACR|nr:hypothetical protein DY000_02012823 [Brassica cretica]